VYILTESVITKFYCTFSRFGESGFGQLGLNRGRCSAFMSAARHSMEQGELEASPDLCHSPHIILEPDISSPDR